MVRPGSRNPSVQTPLRKGALEESVAEKTLRALALEIKRRREDKPFQERLQKSMRRSREVLERLAEL